MTPDNDQAAVEALCNVHEDGCRTEAGAHAILDAIRKGEVPTVCNLTTNEMTLQAERDALMVQIKILRGSLEASREMGRKAQMESDALRAERDLLRAEVEREKARADKAEADLDYVRTCKNLEMVNRHGGRIVVGFSDNLCVESFAMKWISDNHLEVRDFTLDDVWNATDVVDRCDKATAERDRLAGLLHECRNDMINGLTLGEAADLERRIDAALAEVK